MTRVLLIHQAFASPDEPGGTRHYELARRALGHGVQLTIVASEVSYLTGERNVSRDGLFVTQNLDGVQVLRTYAHPSLHRSFGWRVISFLSFMISSIRTALKSGPVDVVMGTSPPIFQAVSAWVVALIRRRPFLLEVRDLWPAFAIEMRVLKNPILIGLSRVLEGFIYARARHLLVNSPAYRDHLIARGVPDSKITLVPNGADVSMFNPDSSGESVRREFDLGEKFVVVYAGALGVANDIETILKASHRLLSHDQIVFLIVGDGKERSRLQACANDLNLRNVRFAGARPKSEMPEILAAADACVATLMNIPMFGKTYPNKVFDYMAAGRPTVLAIDGVIRQVLQAAGGGIFTQPGDDAALAEGVRALSEDRNRGRLMGQRARVYVEQHFNRDQQAADFAKLLAALSSARRSRGPSAYLRFGKRSLDLLLSSSALLLLSPLIALLALLVRFKLGSPVIFRQQRPGFNGIPFTLCKFRTMADARDSDGHLLADDQRSTTFGRFLRSTSLDELPELFNVLRGEMSLVGPRPLLMEYLDRYTPEQSGRHDVRPGITGWAQVNGRNVLAWDEKFAFDLWYVEHQSFLLDLRILTLTVWKLLRREGINQPGESTAAEFLGRSR